MPHTRKEWRRDDNMRELYEYYPDLFTIRVHYEGTWELTPLKEYEGGEVRCIDQISLEYFSLLDVSVIALGAGYEIGTGVLFLWKVPGLNLERGLRPLQCNDHVVEFLNHARQTRFMDLYFDDEPLPIVAMISLYPPCTVVIEELPDDHEELHEDTVRSGFPLLEWHLDGHNESMVNDEPVHHDGPNDHIMEHGNEQEEDHSDDEFIVQLDVDEPSIEFMESDTGSEVDDAVGEEEDVDDSSGTDLEFPSSDDEDIGLEDIDDGDPLGTSPVPNSWAKPISLDPSTGPQPTLDEWIEPIIEPTDQTKFGTQTQDSCVDHVKSSTEILDKLQGFRSEGLRSRYSPPPPDVPDVVKSTGDILSQLSKDDVSQALRKKKGKGVKSVRFTQRTTVEFDAEQPEFVGDFTQSQPEEHEINVEGYIAQPPIDDDVLFGMEEDNFDNNELERELVAQRIEEERQFVVDDSQPHSSGPSKRTRKKRVVNKEPDNKKNKQPGTYARYEKEWQEHGGRGNSSDSGESDGILVDLEM